MDTFKITNIKQAVKNPERVNVFVDGKYEFSLDVTQLLDLKLKVGQEITLAQLSEYKKLSEYGKLYQRTLEWVLSRPRSEKETSDYLYKKIYEKKLDKEYIGKIIEKLEKKKYLNDEAFAKWYVENRFVKKGISKKRLSLELAKKGISREIVERVLKDSGRDEKEEILKIIAKKRARYDDDKLIQYLGRQGFSYELAKDLVLASGTDSRNSE
ncbi:RecX family transcriptional regulator [Candidatus Saccharibacteria bacterium]|nr:RecX family transcriptional regulator [Candidatus Saccharibacteria bacterium]